MKRIVTFIICILLITPSVASADWLSDIFFKLGDIYGVNLDMKNLNGRELTELQSLVSGLSGTHSYGSLYYNSNQFVWGDGADNWQNLLSLYKTGSAGELASVIQTLSKQFPINDSLGSSNKTENEYYRLQAETTLASRSSSQLAFDQISKEAKIMASLQSEIDKAKDNKSSVDLNNRLVSEQNNISIQQAKLLALLVQQSAVDAQEKSIRAKEDAEFFDLK